MIRERQRLIRLSPEEDTRLDALAEHYGLNPAAVIRMLIKRDFDALGLAPRVTKKSKK
jgi:predicted DNA-binding protein